VIGGWGLTGVGHPRALLEVLSDDSLPVAIQCVANALDTSGLDLATVVLASSWRNASPPRLPSPSRCAGELDGMTHVADFTRADDQCPLLIDGSVPDQPRLVALDVGRPHDLTPDLRLEGANRAIGQPGVCGMGHRRLFTADIAA
jgi:hypothetical protein